MPQEHPALPDKYGGAVHGSAGTVAGSCCFDGVRKSVRDELRPHVPVRDHTLGAPCDGGGTEYRRGAGSRGDPTLSSLGRALDLGCGRGQYTPELVRRGWEAVGIDYVPTAIEAAAASGQDVAGLSYDAMPAHSCRDEDVILAHCMPYKE